MKVNIIIEAIKSIVFLIVVIAIGSISLWLYYESYVVPLLNIKPRVIADPLFFMSAIFGLSLSFVFVLVFGFFMVILVAWFINKQITLNPKMTFNVKYPVLKRYFLCFVFPFVFFSVVSNAYIINKVIPDNNYILCPKEAGYKKNLLREYVLDLSLCEKF